LGSELLAQLATTAREMPSDGDGVDAKEGCDGGHRESIDLRHHDDRSATRWQRVEGLPNSCPDEKRRLRITVLGCRLL